MPDARNELTSFAMDRVRETAVATAALHDTQTDKGGPVGTTVPAFPVPSHHHTTKKPRVLDAGFRILNCRAAYIREATFSQLTRLSKKLVR